MHACCFVERPMKISEQTQQIVTEVKNSIATTKPSILRKTAFKLKKSGKFT